VGRTNGYHPRRLVAIYDRGNRPFRSQRTGRGLEKADLRPALSFEPSFSLGARQRDPAPDPLPARMHHGFVSLTSALVPHLLQNMASAAFSR
jgi:hypothetical protein